MDDGGGEELAELTSAVARTVAIKRHGEADSVRHVVLLNVQLGRQRAEVEFTLAERAGYEFPVLVGRDLLAGRYVVDVSREKIGK